MKHVGPKAILFDLDGTLLDTIDDLADCMNATLAEDGLPTIPVERQKYMVGDGVRKYVLRALPSDRHFNEAYVAEFTRRFRAAYGAHWADKTRPYAGVPEMLSALGRAGVRMAVLSNKPDGPTREMVCHFLGAFDFAVVRGAVEGVPLKPDPTPALRIAEELGVAPARFLYLGDTATDMQAARAAGMCAVGALWGFRSREELVDAGAQQLVARPMDVLDLI